MKSQERMAFTGEVGVVDLWKSFGKRTILAGATLSVQAGESLAIMGHSGSGKSTLLHLISGIDVPDSGSVVYGSDRGDVEVSALSARERTGIRRRHLGFVFQRDMLLPDLTAGENVALSCLLDGMTKKEALKVAMDRLTSVGLSAYSGQRPGELSGGEARARGHRTCHGDRPADHIRRRADGLPRFPHR